jgi:hypothetical protein
MCFLTRMCSDTGWGDESASASKGHGDSPTEAHPSLHPVGCLQGDFFCVIFLKRYWFLAGWLQGELSYVFVRVRVRVCVCEQVYVMHTYGRDDACLMGVRVLCMKVCT